MKEVDPDNICKEAFKKGDVTLTSHLKDDYIIFRREDWDKESFTYESDSYGNIITYKMIKIKPCEHENVSMSQTMLTSLPPKRIKRFFCEDCNKEIKPVNWEVCE